MLFSNLIIEIFWFCLILSVDFSFLICNTLKISKKLIKPALIFSSNLHSLSKKNLISINLTTLNWKLNFSQEMLKIHDESEDIFEVNFQRAVEQVGIQVIPPSSPIVHPSNDHLKKSRSVDDTLDGHKGKLPPVENPWKLKSEQQRKSSGALNRFPVPSPVKSRNQNTYSNPRRSGGETNRIKNPKSTRTSRQSLQSEEKLNWTLFLLPSWVFPEHWKCQNFVEILFVHHPSRPF